MAEKHELSPEQVETLERAFEEGVENVDRDDAQHVLVKEPKARQKAEDLIQAQGRFVTLGRQILLLYDMLRAWWNDAYPVPWKTAAAITAALLYFINPFDIVPDFIPVIGYLDDAVVVGACLKLIQSDLRAFASSKGLSLPDYGL